MSLETKSKALVALYKKEERLQKQLNELRDTIRESKNSLNESFEKIGLNCDFS